MANKWFSAILGFIVPPLAFIYLAKLRMAAAFFVFLILSGIADYYLTSVIGYSFIGFALSVLTAIYAFKISKNVRFPENRKWYSRWWGTLSIPLTLFALIFLTRSFVIEPYSIPSRSMSPTLQEGDYVLVKKWGYGLYGSYGITLVNLKSENRVKPERGEVVVLIPPHKPYPFVERIIGLPGDIIEFSNKQITINGNPIETEFLDSGVVKETFGNNVSTVQYINENSRLRSGKWVVPDEHYFVMGDNRDNSADSRVWGMAPAENIVGLVIMKW